ncbi:GNAT family N-acetyltransferase [Streptomyces sp. NPDC003077]|uniref:GNAT family N-acetyltransferase n=1 Tax=Streptomyces sp. NPDC003077 TaxID=3154443 RepID=UPI0033BED578
MDHQEMLELYDRQLRREARPDGPGARIESADGVVRQVAPADGGWNGVLWSDLDRDGADAAIAAQVRYFASLGREFEWKHHSHDRPDDLPDRLLAAGFTAEPAETLMVARAEELTAPVALPEGLRLLPVTDRAGVELMAEVHQQAFGSGYGHIRDRLLALLDDAPELLVAVVAMAGDVPVSAARMEFCPGTGFAGLWGGGTVAAWRGKGIYRALIAHRARVAVERGYPYLQVDASDQSRPILHRLGFVPLSVTTPYVYQP